MFSGNMELTPQRLRELLHYDADSGVFRWLVSLSPPVRVGSKAGRICGGGYVQISINKRIYMAHRLAWFYVNECWPDGQIDHLDGMRSNNRLKNLRVVTQSENNQNQRRALRNNLSSGLLGVTWHKSKKRWIAQIQLNGKRTTIGRYMTPELAYDAYLRAKRQMHPAGLL